MKKYLVILLLIEVTISAPLTSPCEPGENFCSKCNQLTNLCIKCIKDVFKPDDKGGCTGSKICTTGKNYCEECNEEKNVCQTCAVGFHADENGGCSYIDNCKISFRGECLICKKGFILVGQSEGFKICKSLELEDYMNCQKIDYITGLCEECEEDYYLNEGDKKCIETKNCFESSYGQCISCKYGYYLDKSNKKCKEDNQKNSVFNNCKESEDGESCSKCEDGYYLDKNGKCSLTNFCSKFGKIYCEECNEGFYLSSDKNSCSTSENCYKGDKDSGICISCDNNYYLDLEDRECKSNQEDDDLKYCAVFSEKCLNCINGYKLGEDNKCSKTQFCAKSEYGKCQKCSKNYYLGNDSKCSIVENCIKSSEPESCNECEEGYYYHANSNKCIVAEGDLKKCKVSDNEQIACSVCRDDYYLLPSDGKCYSNKEGGNLYKCEKADYNGDECVKCISGYFISRYDRRCSKTDKCASSEDGECLECEESYCLDVKNKRCEDNDFIETKEKKFLYKCKKTNKEGTECGECLEGYSLGNNALCVDEIHCEKKKGGVCIKCLEEEEEEDYFYCLNEDFGCVKTYYNKNCLKCKDILDFDTCSECLEGYKLNNKGECIEEKNEEDK